MLEFYKPRRKELKLNFCRTCEIEFEMTFRDEFMRSSPIPQFGKYVGCTRHYQDYDGNLMTCLKRLTKALVQYTSPMSCHTVRQANNAK